MTIPIYMGQYLPLILSIFFTVMGVWRGWWPFYIAAAFVWLFQVFAMWPVSHPIAYVLVLPTAICFAGAAWDRR